MKKLLLIITLVSIMMLSCKKDEVETTAYRVVNNQSKFVSSMPYLNATMYEIVVYCYKGNDIVRQDNIENVIY